jgi:hypothetical protein
VSEVLAAERALYARGGTELRRAAR